MTNSDKVMLKVEITKNTHERLINYINKYYRGDDVWIPYIMVCAITDYLDREGDRKQLLKDINELLQQRNIVKNDNFNRRA